MWKFDKTAYAFGCVLGVALVIVALLCSITLNERKTKEADYGNMYHVHAVGVCEDWLMLDDGSMWIAPYEVIDGRDYVVHFYDNYTPETIDDLIDDMDLLN